MYGQFFVEDSLYIPIHNSNAEESDGDKGKHARRQTCDFLVEEQCPRGPDAEICDICHCNQYLYRIRRRRGDKQTISVVLCSCGGMPTNSRLLHPP